LPKITKRFVDSLERGADRYIRWDDDIKGFGVVVQPSGVKSYLYRYRTPEGEDRRPTIGKHGALTPDQARSKAEEMRQAVFGGADPLKEKRERRQAATVADVLDSYLASEAFKGKAPSTRLTDKGRIERHLKPLLGRRPVDTLTQEQIERTFNAIRDGKTATREKMGHRALARVRGGEGAARKSVRLLRSVFAWAVRERMIKDNPAATIRTGSDGARDIILDDAQAYGRLFQTLDRMEAEKRIRQSTADAIRVIALTGARRGEIAGLRWSYVNLKNGTVTLPPAAHKTGKATGKPRVIGLPAAAQALISRQPQGGQDDYVFAPAHGQGPVQLTKLWTKIRVEAALPEGIGLHGLRHSLASHMAMQGAQASQIMTALGHRNLSTSQKYVHWAQEARQAIAEQAASVALAGLAASNGAHEAEIVRIKGK
jgi:integrase